MGRASAFAVTFTGFLLIHASRKTFSAVKESLLAVAWFKDDGLFSGAEEQDAMLGCIDALFLFGYAFGPPHKRVELVECIFTKLATQTPPKAAVLLPVPEHLTQ